jgi:hypothetical protein
MHVFGAGQGESIVLRLPTGGWGVVDCYASSLASPAENPTCRFLTDQHVDRLEFVCLTHPHDDHFRGMSHLLEKFQVRLFWRPSAMLGQKLRWLLKLAHMEAKTSGDQTAADNASELERIFTLVRERRKQRKEPLLPRNATIATQLYPVPLDPNGEFQIWAVAPSGRQCEGYEESLHKCFDANGRLKDSLPYSRHNEISLALLVLFGTTRLILGGDVENAGWTDGMNEFGIQHLSAAAVKVSHHGSTNGYCDGLWKGFAANGKPVAVVTPYRRHRLPRRPGLQHIAESVERIVTPCLAAIPPEEFPIPLSSKAPPKSRKALHDKLKAAADTSFPTGKCSFVFDNMGNCVDEKLETPAGIIARGS